MIDAMLSYKQGEIRSAVTRSVYKVCCKDGVVSEIFLLNFPSN